MRFFAARAGHGKTVPSQFRGHGLQPVIDGHIISQWILRFRFTYFTWTGRLTACPARGMLPRQGAGTMPVSQGKRGTAGTGRAGGEAVWGLLIRPRSGGAANRSAPRRQHDQTRRVCPHRGGWWLQPAARYPA